VSRAWRWPPSPHVAARRSRATPLHTPLILHSMWWLPFYTSFAQDVLLKLMVSLHIEFHISNCSVNQLSWRYMELNGTSRPNVAPPPCYLMRNEQLIVTKFVCFEGMLPLRVWGRYSVSCRSHQSTRYCHGGRCCWKEWHERKGIRIDVQST